ncbi:hypothetical protein POVWA2_023800 [Plasmodium ovale wallikeri]|uniref:PIR Superfamily Protein n=1 Tax=Plasmodium ovale wallikeri TaxID=864142 RepID=A0A1A8YT04_PLAOA|nr:hypothetical protein POVWA1_023910 [Plasmodium ovale wallikeri]SBT35202.1 hypothetical protein POVWA2_023800 [Plasmodium ovale wallikeri]
MKINSRKLKKYPEKCKKFIPQPLNDKNNVLCVNDSGINTEATNELGKCNNNETHGKLQLQVFLLSLSMCYNNYILKFSVFIRLYQVLLLQLALANGVDSQTSSSSRDGAELSNGGGSATLLQDPVGFFRDHIHCIFSGKKQHCIELTFLFLALLGTALSIIGGIFTFFYKCGICCFKSRDSRRRKEEIDYRKQFDQMQQQMQMQQQQMQMQQQQIQQQQMQQQQMQQQQMQQQQMQHQQIQQQHMQHQQMQQQHMQEQQIQQQQLCEKLMNSGLLDDKNNNKENKDGENDKKNDGKKKKKLSKSANKSENTNSKNEDLHIGYHVISN